MNKLLKRGKLYFIHISFISRLLEKYPQLWRTAVVRGTQGRPSAWGRGLAGRAAAVWAVVTHSIIFSRSQHARVWPRTACPGEPAAGTGAGDAASGQCGPREDGAL